MTVKKVATKTKKLKVPTSGVSALKGKAKPLLKMNRKESFLTRIFASPQGPIPKTMAAAKRFVSKGRHLLKKYQSKKASAA